MDAYTKVMGAHDVGAEVMDKR